MHQTFAAANARCMQGQLSPGVRPLWQPSRIANQAIKLVILASVACGCSQESTDETEYNSMLQDQPISAVHIQIWTPALNMREDVKEEIRAKLTESGYIISAHLPSKNAENSAKSMRMVFLEERKDLEYLKNAENLDRRALEEIESEHRIIIQPHFVNDGNAAIMVGSFLDPDYARLVFLPAEDRKFGENAFESLNQIFRALRTSSLIERVEWGVPPHGGEYDEPTREVQ